MTEERHFDGPTIKPGQSVGPSPGGRAMSMVPARAVLAPDGKTLARYSRRRFLPMVAPTVGPDGKPRPHQPAASPAFELFSTEAGQPLGVPPVTTAQAVLVVNSGDSRRILLVSSTGPAPLLESILH